jgi:hypothetical protein
MRNAESFSTITHVEELLQTCTSQHPLCQEPLSGSRHRFTYPVRMLEIIKGTTCPTLRLVTMKDSHPRYATLSHRWKGGEVWKTKTENFPQNCLELPYSALSKTFRDAINFSIALDIRHLWIDSICIIQDDDVDWQQQSAQMGMIFERSVCTFAAIDAISDDENDKGLFLDRDMLPVKISIDSSYSVTYDTLLSDLPQENAKVDYRRHGTALDVEALSSEAWGAARAIVKPEHTPFDMSIDRSAWNTRGWVFQERVLSTRMLYFTKEQVFWECAECIESEHHETGPELKKKDAIDLELLGTENTTSSTRRLHRMLRRSKQAHVKATQLPTDDRSPSRFFDTWEEFQKLKAWWLITERYSECQLTFTTDRWFAIQGLCEVMRQQFESEIHAGIWDVGIGACLLWQARQAPLQPFADFKAPSWSWLALNGPISYLYRDDSYMGCFQKVCPLVEKHTFHEVSAINTINPRTTGFSGRLDLTCPTAWASISKTQFKDLHFREVTGHVEDQPAWKFFHDISQGRSKVELAREFREAERIPFARFLYSEISSENNDVGDSPEGLGKRAIGWVVLDRDILPGENVLCAAIVMRILEGSMEAEQHVVECLVLVKKADPGSFMRVGRGRLVERGWLDGCNVDSISIF